MPGTRKLGRASDHRKAMLRAMVTFLLENGKIETTVTRAKEVRAMTEKMITIAKKDDLAAKRQVLAYVTKEDVAKKLFDEIAPKYAASSSSCKFDRKHDTKQSPVSFDTGLFLRFALFWGDRAHLSNKLIY